ncbi:MAG: hypothetical protein HY711_00840 [Candidatus Melainabacteria bacterium]|nr:hypothetical protein [Candidatus Melainabacteria bacterium]
MPNPLEDLGQPSESTEKSPVARASEEAQAALGERRVTVDRQSADTTVTQVGLAPADQLLAQSGHPESRHDKLPEDFRRQEQSSGRPPGIVDHEAHMISGQLKEMVVDRAPQNEAAVKKMEQAFNDAILKGEGNVRELLNRVNQDLADSGIYLEPSKTRSGTPDFRHLQIMKLGEMAGVSPAEYQGTLTIPRQPASVPHGQAR